MMTGPRCPPWVASLALLASAFCARGMRFGDPVKAMTIKKGSFMLGDKQVQIRGGEMHYFRIPEIYWEDRLKRLRAMGLNTLSTYVAWNWHEQQEGTIDFSSERRNLVKFLKLAHKHGLMVILRPGPYICAEWDLGGLPAWLLKYTSGPLGMKVRTNDPRYIGFVDRYWGKLLPLMRLQLLEAGGAIVAVVLENEYGHFGNASAHLGDMAYLQHLHHLARKHLGPNVLMLTTDESALTKAGAGSMPGIFSAVNMGPWLWPPSMHLDREFGNVKLHNQDGPEFVMELWTGWFNEWGHNLFGQKALLEGGRHLADYVSELVHRNASFTLYMAHGGTNFGFWASGSPEPGFWVATTYDYIAPISEAGAHNKGFDGVDKFTAIRKVLSDRATLLGEPLPPEEEPAPPVRSYLGEGPGGEVPLHQRGALRDPAVLARLCEGGWRSGIDPLPMEHYGQQGGMVLYRHTISEMEAAMKGHEMTMDAHDRATVWHGDNRVTALRSKLNGRLPMVSKLPTLKAGDQLDILVENLGRRAFFERNGHTRKSLEGEWKGLRKVWLEDTVLEGKWQACSLPLSELAGAVPSATVAPQLGPAFFEGNFSISGEPADTFLRLDDGPWTTGSAFINGFNLGRYYREANAPFDLYVPKSVLKTAENRVVVLEMDPSALENKASPSVRFDAQRAPSLRAFSIF